MKRWIVLAKFVAVGCSVALLAAYICYRTTGHFFSFSEAGQLPTHPSDVSVMGGSKSRADLEFALTSAPNGN